MQIAIAVGTLLLGGWVLDAPEDQDSAAPAQGSPSATAPGTGPITAPSMQPGAAGATDHSRGRTPAGQAGGHSAQGGQAGRTQPRVPGAIPSNPTDVISSPGAQGMPTQPTIPAGSVPPGNSFGVSGMGGGPMMGQTYGSLQPSSPTERGVSASQSGYHPTLHGSGGQMQGRSMPMLNSSAANIAPPVNTPNTAQPGGEKAFSGYRAPSGTSPYLNLFRNGNAAGTIDNYSTLVKPQLDQRYMNQQFGQDIRGLRQDYRTQGMNLQQLNRDNRAAQGVGTPQFYQNTGGYYNYPGNGQ